MLVRRHERRLEPAGSARRGWCPGKASTGKWLVKHGASRTCFLLNESSFHFTVRLSPFVGYGESLCDLFRFGI